MILAYLYHAYITHRSFSFAIPVNHRLSVSIPGSENFSAGIEELLLPAA
jgi:hypothetical protein